MPENCEISRLLDGLLVQIIFQNIEFSRKVKTFLLQTFHVVRNIREERKHAV